MLSQIIEHDLDFAFAMSKVAGMQVDDVPIDVADLAYQQSMVHAVEYPPHVLDLPA